MKTNDAAILAALRGKKEEALQLTRETYGRYIRKIAFSVLHSEADAEEVENEVLLKLWQHADTEIGTDLKAYLGQISRRTAIDRLREIGAVRRGGGEYSLALEELEECLPAKSGDPLEGLAVRRALDRFLQAQSRRNRRLFLCHYWYGLSVTECAEAFRMSESAVKAALRRCRTQLRTMLEQEEI